MLSFSHSAFLRLQASRRGASGGLVFRDRPYGFSSLAAMAEQIAAWLTRNGIGRGDRVALVMGNSPALVAAHYGCWAVGAVAVPTSVRSTSAELMRLAEHAELRLFLCDDDRVEGVRAAAAATTTAAALVSLGDSLKIRQLRRVGSPVSRAARQAGWDDLAVLAYTSGTTGAPKGVRISHSNLHWATLACATARGDSAAGVGACISPLTHTPVFVSHLLCRIALGQTAVLLEKFDVDAVLAAVERYAITDLSLIAGMAFDLAALPRLAAKRRRSIRKVTVGGAATPMATKRRLAELFVGAEVIEAYGQSESTDGVCMARGTSVFDRPGTIGCPNPYIALAIRRSDGGFAEVGEEGEIVISGPTVMGGYHRDPKASRAQVRDGWLHTGDLGRRDGDDYYFITGRVKDLIITGGENVSPTEIEEVLRKHPRVADVAVIGTPHPRWGEQVTAVVVAKPGPRPEVQALIDFAGTQLASFKRPRRVEFVDALPRNAANKVQTGLLKETYSAKGT